MSYSSEVLADSPGLYWKLDETSGTTAADASGNSRPGTYGGDTKPTLGASSLLTSGAGSAITVTDGEGWVDRAAESWMNDSTGITVTGLIKATSLPPTLGAIWSRDEARTLNRQWVLYVDSAGKLRFIGSTATTSSRDTTSPSAMISAGVTYHIAMSWSVAAGQVTIYATRLDTLAVSSFVVTFAGAPLTDTTMPFRVGNLGPFNHDLGWWFRGHIDEVAYFPGPLSSTQVADHAAAAAAAAGPPSGSGTGVYGWTGSGSGSTDYSGDGAGSYGWTGAGSGTAPAIIPTGSGTGVYGWTGSGSGSTDTSGFGSGQYGWTGTGSGSSGAAEIPSGSGVGEWGWAGSGSGTGSTLYPTTFTILRAPTHIGAAAFPALLPVTPPARVNEWPVTVTAHPMPELADGNRRVKPGIDYTPLRGTVGRLHVWVDGVDVTYLRDVPTVIEDWSSSDPMGDDAARFTCRQIGPWEDLGTGDLAPFDLDRDPAVDIALIAEDGTLTHLWDGHIVSEDDTTDSGDEARTFVCEGTLKAAAHSPHTPPTILDETDIGILIPRVLNGTPNRRFATIAETITGITTSKRGSQDQTRLGYVQMLLATAFTETGAQWTLEKVARAHYDLTLKEVTGYTAEVVKGAIGVELDVKRDEGMRWDGLFGEGVAPNGGHWGNWFFPGLDLFVPPPYPYADTTATISVGDTDAGTTTGDGVTLAQQRLLELGYAVVVTGTFTSADAAATSRMQTDFGLLVDGRIGPQTWTALFTPGLDEIDLQAIRLPLASKAWVLPSVYAANGAAISDNPDHDPVPVPKLPNVKFGADITKAQATVMARRMLAANGEAAWTGRMTLTSDPVDAAGVPFSRFLLREGDRVKVTGHGDDEILRVADASKDGIAVVLEVDERGRNAMTLDAIRERNLEARGNTSERPGSPSKISSLTRDHIVQFEEESKAGQIPHYPVNGNVGLWSVFPIVVSQTGRIAKLDMDALNAVTSYVVAFFGKPIQPQRLAAMVPDPIASADGWRDHEETLILDHAWIETFGQPGQLAGYHPWQQSDGRAVTGKLRDHSGLEFTSERRGYLWVAVFSSASTIVSGRAYPAVPS